MPIVVLTDPAMTKIYGTYSHAQLKGQDYRTIFRDAKRDAGADIKAKTGAKIVAPDEIYDVDADIFSPNALGAIINEDTLKRLKVKVIAGGANNQLVIPQMGEFVRRAGIIYAPDYVINGGGIINVAAEISGTYSREWVGGKLDTLMGTLGSVIDEALSNDEPTNIVADRIAKDRIAAGALAQ